MASAIRLRAVTFCALAFSFFHAHAQAALISASFLFASHGPNTTPVPVTGYDVTVNTADASYTFKLKISSETGTPVWRRRNGGLGVVSPAGSRNMIDGAGEDLTFELSVNTAPANAAASLYDLTFSTATLRSAGNRRDSGSFGGFQNTTGPGNPSSPLTYLWRNGSTGPDFPGMTPNGQFPSFNLRQMNEAPVARFTHTYLSGRYAFRQLDVSVKSNPEPSSFLLAVVAGLLFLARRWWLSRPRRASDIGVQPV